MANLVVVLVSSGGRPWPCPSGCPPMRDLWWDLHGELLGQGGYCGSVVTARSDLPKLEAGSFPDEPQDRGTQSKHTEGFPQTLSSGSSGAHKAGGVPSPSTPQLLYMCHPQVSFRMHSGWQEASPSGPTTLPTGTWPRLPFGVGSPREKSSSLLLCPVSYIVAVTSCPIGRGERLKEAVT